MLSYCIKCKKTHHDSELSNQFCSKCSNVVDESNFVLTARGLVSIDLVDLNDYVYTHRKRLRRVLGIKKEKASQEVKTTLSLNTLIPDSLTLFRLGTGEIPFYPLKDKNDDKHDENFWERVGRALSDTTSIPQDIKNYFIMYKVVSMNDLPVTFLTLSEGKVEALLKGFFKSPKGLKNLTSKGELNLLFLLNRSLKMQHKNNLIKCKDLKTSKMVKTLIVEEDCSYSINGLILSKKTS